MCENKGLHGKGDPKNLVDGGSCRKKMLVMMSVKNNQKGTEKLHATVSRVRDETSNDYARLYNPFMITVSKSPVYNIYPYFFTGYTVNNQPYEEIRMSGGSWWDIDSSKRCYDQWQSKETKTLRPTCGYQYQTKDVKQADGTYKKAKTRIWDSQGFCCHCSVSEKNSYSFDEARNFKRSGLTCKLFTSSSQASGHCMKMDKLWYNVFSFKESYRDFTIHVKAFDQVEKVIGNITKTEYVNGGEIVLSPSRKSGVGKYQRIIAHYVGDFAPVKSYPVLTSKYFLIPKLDGKTDPISHPQLKDGFSKYLILPMSFVDLRGGKCNTIGVSYSSFKNQASSGQGFGCQQKKGYCLMNQPKHYFTEDLDRVENGKTPRWFPARYGKIAGVKKQKANSTNFVLAYELEEEHTSLLSLQISADDLILVYNRASGEIVRAAVKDFESVSLDGKVQVEVLNTGYVSSDFYVTITDCSEGIDAIQEKHVTIDPQVTEKLVFKIRTADMDEKETENTCLVKLYDSRRTLVSTRNVSFSTSAPCVCEVSGCRCECSVNGSVRCVEMEGKWKISPKIWNVNKTAGIFGRIGSFFGNIFGWISGLLGFNFLKYFQYIGPVIGIGILVCCWWQCCGCSCCMRIFCCCKRKGRRHSSDDSDSGGGKRKSKKKKGKKKKKKERKVSSLYDSDESEEGNSENSDDSDSDNEKKNKKKKKKERKKKNSDSDNENKKKKHERELSKDDSEEIYNYE